MREFQVGRHKTKREAVSAALAEYAKRRKQLRILDAFGTIDFDPKYDHKTERRRKHSCPVRQELLSGIRAEVSFRKVRDALRAFDEPQLQIQDYEEAARISHICRVRGIAGQP